MAAVARSNHPRAAVGHPWRIANPEQGKQLTELFTQVAGWFFADTLVQVTTFKILPTRPNEEPGTVHGTFRSTAAPETSSIAFRWVKQADGLELADFAIESLWITTTYRQQFAQVMNQGSTPSEGTDDPSGPYAWGHDDSTIPRQSTVVSRRREDNARR
ncbi:ABC transporter substrate-binding protein [Frankia sp. Mgl5]|uniref:Tgt2/MlaC family protein n=1 Tax=Frankia sp. Mgl5 TaxID=2933793 RepID=UPI00200D42B9|nr:ABC transporter substrate-binding protein [Frankia sp. Mgl5]MCK9928604.1 ABC transporter substrate-binding protein [Frankia sp. Mgl5]